MEYGNEEIRKNPQEDLRAAKRCFSRMALAYVLYTAVSTASQFAIGALLNLMPGVDENQRMTLCILGMYPLAVPAFYLMIRTIPKARQTRRETVKAGEYLGIFVVSVGCMYAGNFIGQALMTAVGFMTGEPRLNMVNELLLTLKPWTILITVVIAAPIIEELLFRKWLLDRIAGYGQITSIMVSGILFGVFHGNFYQFFYAFALGAIFAYVYLKTGNIWYTISLHMIINFCGGLVPMGLLKITEQNKILGPLLTMTEVMVVLGFMIAAVIVLVCCRQKIRLYPGTMDVPRGRWIRTVFLNVGMILFFVTYVVIFILA